MGDKNIYNPFDNLIDYTEPWESIEGEELEEIESPYREASKHFVRIISLSMNFILESNNPLVAAHAVLYALGIHPEGVSMREMGKRLNVSSGTISDYAKKFRRISGLPPSILQQDLSTADKSRQSRISKIND